MPNTAFGACYMACHNISNMDLSLLLLISSKQKRGPLFIILQIRSNMLLCVISTM